LQEYLVSKPPRVAAAAFACGPRGEGGAVSAPPFGAGAACFCECFWSHERVLEAWMGEVNAAVFEPKGMLLKMRGKAWKERRGDKNNRVEIQWIEVALTPEAAAALRTEEAITGEYCPCEKKYRVC